MDAAIDVTEDDLGVAIALREAVYRIVIARLEHRRPQVADVELLNEHASQPRLTPRLLRNGHHRAARAPQRSCWRPWPRIWSTCWPDPASTTSSGARTPGAPVSTSIRREAQNRHWCGMGTCGNKAKVQAFRARQRASVRLTRR